MIGETIKIGFDGSAVKRGLAGIMGGFNKLQKGVKGATRQVAIGAGRQAGASLFGFAMNMATAIPREIAALAELKKELDNIGISTGTAQKEYLALRDAITKTTGKDADEAGDFLRDVSERLGEAMTDFESTPRQAAIKLGIEMRDIKGKTIDEQMAIIAQRFQEFRVLNSHSDAMFQINELLGEVGKQMIPLFMNYEQGMDSARKRTNGLAEQLERNKGSLEGLLSLGATIKRKFSEIALTVLEALKTALNGVGIQVESIAEFIESIDISGFSNKLAKFIASGMEAIKNGEIWQWVKEKLSIVGNWLSEILTKAFGAAIQKVGDAFKNSGATPMSLLMGKGDVFGKFMNELSGKGKQETHGKEIKDNTQETNRLLEDIKNAKQFATFA